MYSFLLVFYRNSVYKMHGIWDILLQKCLDLDNHVTGPSRSLEMSPYDRAHMTSCWRSMVTMAHISFLRYSLLKNVVILKSGSEVTQGHWKWYQWIDRIWFLLVFF